MVRWRTRGRIALDSSHGWRKGRHHCGPQLSCYSSRRAGFAVVTARFANQTASLPITVAFADTEPAIDDHANNFVDKRVIDGWRRARIQPSKQATDLQFCRRVYLQLIGQQPTTGELLRFLRDDSSQRRKRLIDELLKRDEYFEHWSYIWAEWLLGTGEVDDDDHLRLVRWLTRQLRQPGSIRQIVHKLLAANGRTADNAAVTVYAAHPTAIEMAETTSQVFLGKSLGCARCHRHPTAGWKAEEFRSISTALEGLVVKGEKPDSPFVISGPIAPRRGLADEITIKRKRDFARNLVNRYWAELLGRGLYNPLGDFQTVAACSHPELLEELTDDLLAHDCDVQHLLRTICSSRAYQLSHEFDSKQGRDQWFLSHFPVQRAKPWVLRRAMQLAAGAKLGRQPFSPTGHHPRFYPIRVAHRWPAVHASRHQHHSQRSR